MDDGFTMSDARVREAMAAADRFVFHAPFNELCPAAIDPLIVRVAKKRYARAYELMRGYGVDRMVVHSGFVPMIYFEEWFVDKSIGFWKDFLSDKPAGFKLYLENVLESSPAMLVEIAAAVDDERFGLCFDIGHAAIIDPDMVMGQWAEQMQPFLGHIHIHNNYGKRDTHNALGDGVIDIAAAIRLFDEVAPAATLTIETSDGKSSVAWLVDNGFL